MLFVCHEKQESDAIQLWMASGSHFGAEEEKNQMKVFRRSKNRSKHSFWPIEKQSKPNHIVSSQRF